MSMLFRPKPPPRKYSGLYEKIKKSGIRLDALCNVYRGMWTGILHVFIVSEEEINEYNLELDALRPILRGKDIGPFRYKWAGKWVIYTNQENFEERFPNVIKYLSKWKRVLERRSAVWIYGRKWWELEDPLEPKMFEVEKIMSPYISKINAFTYEEGKYYALDSTAIIRFWFDEEEAKDYFTKWKETNEKDLDVNEIINIGFNYIKDMGKNKDSLLYLTGLLNSDLMEFFYKLYAPKVTKRGSRRTIGRYFLYIPPYLNVLPIRISSAEDRREVIDLVKKISEKAFKLVELEEESDEKVALEEEILSLMADLNEVVFNIYNLSEDEKATIQAYVLRRR